MTKRFGLKKGDIEKIQAVFHRYPQVKKAVLYGSRATGAWKNNSDIDLVLVGHNDLTLQILYRIMNEIDDLLLPYIFDISIYSKINDKEVLEHIKQAGVTFYKNEQP